MLSAALFLLALTPAGTDTIFEDGFDDAPTGCPANRQELADFAYAGDDSLRNRYDVDVTEWENIWGHATALDATVPWPGRSNSSPVFLNFGKSNYIAAHFQVPPGTPSTWFGWIIHTEYQYGTDLTGAISPVCGDFSPAAQHCYSQGTSGQTIVPWRTTAGTFCELVPGSDYFLNLKIRDPDQTNVSCAPSATECMIGTANAINAP
jgi:hypothetical protein